MKVTCISMMSRPDLIYDVAAAAQVFSKGDFCCGGTRKETLKVETEIRKRKKERKKILAICPDL